MTIPQGVSGYQPSQCCKLKRSLYGLKQASHQWFAKLSSLLQHYGFTKAHADHNLFTKVTCHTITVLLIYVDDIVLVGNSIAEIDKAKHLLSSNFHIPDLGKLKYFLGIEVAHSSSGISLCQRRYCLDLISDAGLLNSKPCSTPMETSSPPP